MTGTPTTTKKPRRNPWPIVIVSYFAVFITGIVIWIVYASGQQMELVRTDYYEKEILFQQQIDSTRRAKQADVKVAYDDARQSITLQLPTAHKQAHASGTIQLYRPSNAHLDQTMALDLSPEGTQRLDTRSLLPGLWKVRLSWRVSGEDYYFDQPIVIGGNS